MIGQMLARPYWQLVGPVALWGKMPCRGDFIRRNLPFEQEKALEEWVRQKRSTFSSPKEIQRKMTNGIPWSSLDYQARRPVLGYADQPWCFVLPPRSLPFTVNHYLIGVWMNSSDKVGREYPIIMIQAATRRWVMQYFAFHAEQPCEWLFNAAHLIARSIRIQQDEADRLPDSGTEIDQIAVFQTRLNALWSLYAPDWRNFLGKRISLSGKKAHQIQNWVDPPARLDDPAQHLDGVRFLPWADWPDCLLDSPVQGFFWQQNLHGRFISAIRV
jgi:type VI secretion system protein ImpM